MADRSRCRITLLLAGIAVAAGLAAQHRLDAACSAQRAGYHWNSDVWLCESGDAK